MTPEGKIKAKLDRELKLRKLWSFNPQAGVYGRAGVPDKIVCAGGRFIGLECKADHTKKPTPLQIRTMAAIEAAGGKCFVVYDEATIKEAMEFIDDLQDTAPTG
jgi:hypothetical protein